MKTKLLVLTLGSSLLYAPALLAQNNAATNNSQNLGNNLSANVATNLSNGVTNAQPRNHPKNVAGEPLLLPPGLKEQLKLTDGQRTELKLIEDDFAKTSQEYEIANQPRIEAAQEANRQARASKDPAQIQAAHLQWQQVWAGLQPYRVAALNHVKPVLTPDQIKILDDPQNPGPDQPANDLSAK